MSHILLVLGQSRLACALEPHAWQVGSIGHLWRCVCGYAKVLFRLTYRTTEHNGFRLYTSFPCAFSQSIIQRRKKLTARIPRSDVAQRKAVVAHLHAARKHARRKGWESMQRKDWESRDRIQVRFVTLARLPLCTHDSPASSARLQVRALARARDASSRQHKNMHKSMQSCQRRMHANKEETRQCAKIRKHALTPPPRPPPPPKGRA